MSNDENPNSRAGYRAKRKKTNRVLNSLIVIVSLLIIIVAYNIFASGNDDAKDKKETQKTEQKGSVASDSKDQEVSADKNSSEVDKTDEDQVDQDQADQETETTDQADDSQTVVSEGGSSSNVIKTIENPSWKPVGTTQTGEHTPVFDGVDWQEMLNAISYATDLDQSSMKVFWLGRDQSASNAAVGTVYSSDKTQKYRVHIKWVDGEGWMPTMVEELTELEK